MLSFPDMVDIFVRGGVSPTRRIEGGFCHHTAFLSVVLPRKRVFDTRERLWRILVKRMDATDWLVHSCVSETRPFNNTILSDQRECSVVTLYTSHTSVSETRHQLWALCWIRKRKGTVTL